MSSFTQVYSSGNYVIYETNTVQKELAKGYTTYSYNETTETFTIRESVGSTINITKAEINAGLIKNDASVAYTFNTFTTFLRENTGFKTAPGGSGAAPIGAKLLKTNQSVSYRTGDDGDIEAGRDVSFFTLPGNNPYGNTKRFLDELGTEVFTNKIVIDWSTYDGSTVLGYYTNLNGSNVNWDQAIDGAAALSVGSFTSGWRLPNRNEFNNIVNDAQTYPINYAPFNFTISYTYWCSTSLAVAPTVYAYRYLTYNLDPVQLKTVSVNCRFFAVRTFTVSGTTLS